MLFSAYRKDDFADPEGFVAQLGIILADFPTDVVTYVTSPRTGLQRRMKWPPTISEVIEACEDHKLHLERLKKLKPLQARSSTPALIDLSPGSLAKIFVPDDHARYASLVAWSEKADAAYWKFGKSSDGRTGIWVCMDAWESRSHRGS